MEKSEKDIQPFQLIVEPQPNASCALVVLQRPFPASRNGRDLPFVQMGRIDGLALSSIWDLVLDTLRSNHHKPTILTCRTKKPIGLSEASSVRLSLLFKAVAHLSNLDLIRDLQQAIWGISDEEAYYWFAKCSGPNGHQGVWAIRILYGLTSLSKAEWLRMVSHFVTTRSVKDHSVSEMQIQ